MFLVPYYAKLKAHGVTGSARATIPCPITDDERFMFAESGGELDDVAKRVLQEILSQRPKEKAITPRMIEEALIGFPTPNTSPAYR